MADFGVSEAFMAMSAVGTAMQVAGNMSAAAAARSQAQSQQNMYNYQAAIAKQNAGQQQAAAQRKALDQTRQANLIASRAIAMAGAGGGGVTDPTVINLVSDIQGEGMLRHNTAIYQGEEAARQSMMQATSDEWSGNSAIQTGSNRAKAYETAAAGAAFTGAGSLYGRFGGGGPKVAGLTDGAWKDAGSVSTPANIG